MCGTRSVVFIDNFAQEFLGGGEVYLLQLADALIEAGYRVGFVCQSGSRMLRVCSDLSDDVAEMDFSALVPIVAAKRIGAWVEEKFGKSPNVCIQGSGFYTDLIAALSCKGQPWKLVATMQTEIVHPDGSAAEAVSDKSREIVRRLIRPRVTTYLAVSTALKEQLVSQGVEPEYITVIPNSVNVESFQQRVQLADPLEIFADKPKGERIGFLGRLEHVKRVDLLLDAFSTLAPSHPNSHLFIAGDGSLVQELREQAETLSAGSERVHFLGFIDPTRFLGELDVFCMPSDYEGMCTAVLEAQAAGVPVVVTKVGGMQELVQDGVTGRTVPAGDIKAFVAAIEKTLSGDSNERALTTAYVQQALERAGRLFDTEGLVEKVLDFYMVVFEKD